MVRNRLITILTINNGVLFRTRNFIPDYRYTLNFVDAWSIDEIVILDITKCSKKDTTKAVRGGSIPILQLVLQGK